MLPFKYSLLRLIYPIPDTRLERDRPMQVLALGISRTGTDSLRNALAQLGYKDIHHGFRFILNVHENLQWLRLAHAQTAGNKSGLNVKDFDKVLGDCNAVTDQPSCGFAHELLDAYPEAKVILNYREDVEKWHASVLNSAEKFDNYPSRYEWLLSYLQSSLFWQQHVMMYWMWRRYFDADFEKNGRTYYAKHYQVLEDKLNATGRPYLRWKVEDGWEPLCKFLDKSIPSEPFPNGNAPEEYLKRIGSFQIKRRQEAERNFRILCGVAVAGMAGFGAYVMYPRR